MGRSKMEDLNITLERRREIDEILKETERKYKNGEIKSIPLEAFLKEQKKKQELREMVCDLLNKAADEESETRIKTLKDIISIFVLQNKNCKEIYEIILLRDHYKNISKEEFDKLYRDSVKQFVNGSME